MVMVIMCWAKQQIELIEGSIIVLALWVMVRLRVGMRDNVFDQSVVVMMLDGEPPS